ncbi:Cell surface receptor MFS transporter protein [Lasiodiplodia theobromae]|uniref:Cell surface receptor MFS transporter protein n=1 Tax=Lasiodiplodia theobromae TaxID=45133 RepID=UPI0015C39A5A|nr:Cell surface receptor MFS transporter protein [Lasiodiplodia theobromae]KAF4536821.1 Cell surface receptor MFS transporter protein [Lasiodiplodia theobromae]
MDDVSPQHHAGEKMAAHEVHSDAPLRDGSRDEDGSRPSGQDAHAVREQHSDNQHAHGHHRVYRRRWFGLLQLVLLNVIISWDWLTFAAVSSDSAEYFHVTETAINWLSTAVLFAFVATSPIVLTTLHRGPKPAIITASIFALIGNWVRYAGTRAGSHGYFGVVMFGQILIGIAQPFVLAAPTRYSDLWFTERGRISATALASLANPFGGALGQLIDPFWATKPSEIPNMVLYTAIIATVAAIPSFFIPARPPTPPSASTTPKPTAVLPSLRFLALNPTFWLILLPFGVYVGFFNAFSSLLNQILYPYGFTSTDAGICGALLIFVGLAASAILSPLLDRRHPKPYLRTIKLFCPVIGACYLAFIWAPPTRSLAAPYVVSSVLGAASFALVPVALEYLVEATWPAASPEAGSVLCWTAGQLFGAIFIVIMNALKEPGCSSTKQCEESGKHSTGWKPPGSMWRALIFQAVVALAVLPAPLLLGVRRLGLGAGHRKGRMEAEDAEERGEVEESGEGGGEAGRS